MRRGVQVSFGERNPTRDTGTVQSVCGFVTPAPAMYFLSHKYNVCVLTANYQTDSAIH